jgi:hypothetical protein
VALAFVVKLPYRSSEIVRAVEATEPSPDVEGRFQVGDMTWDTALFAHEPKLEPLRVYFRAHCDGRAGGAAATCLSDQFVREFPQGDPVHELFDTAYDPAADLAAHASGEPGHCVTRSGLITSILLSVGIPARVVQMVTPKWEGHTVMSVWDAAHGWMAFDPSWGAFLSLDGKPASAWRVASRSDDLGPLPSGLVPDRGPGVHTAQDMYTMWGKMNGKDVKMMEIAYTRATTSATAQAK